MGNGSRSAQTVGDSMKAISGPPKDGTAFMARFIGHNTPMSTMWNAAEGEYAVAMAHVESFHGKWNDTHWENELFREDELESWWDLEGEK